MIECSYCGNWFHIRCVNDGESASKGEWAVGRPDHAAATAYKYRHRRPRRWLTSTSPFQLSDGDVRPWVRHCSFYNVNALRSSWTAFHFRRNTYRHIYGRTTSGSEHPHQSVMSSGYLLAGRPRGRSPSTIPSTTIFTSRWSFILQMSPNSCNFLCFTTSTTVQCLCTLLLVQLNIVSKWLFRSSQLSAATVYRRGGQLCNLFSSSMLRTKILKNWSIFQWVNQDKRRGGCGI